jgi:hypothetical protein
VDGIAEGKVTFPHSGGVESPLIFHISSGGFRKRVKMICIIVDCLTPVNDVGNEGDRNGISDRF